MRIETKLYLTTALLVVISTANAFQATAPRSAFPTGASLASQSPLFASSAAVEDVSTKHSKRQLIRKQGGPLAFSTKYGALNPYAIYYGIIAIGLGIPWFFALKLYSFFQFVTRGRFDKRRRVPTFLNHLWGVTLMRLTRSFPTMENKEILQEFFKE